MVYLRQPIISVLGHVDHGKTSLLDFIRDSNLIHKEAGGITQHIGATEIPKKELIDLVKSAIPEDKIKIPGLLFIDTPGHKAFTSLRKRGGNISDIGILVVDINEGFKPQTIEALEILKTSKTPFIIAANKIDLIPYWTKKSENLLENINSQREETVYKFEEKLYELVGKVNEIGIESDRFDRVEDFTKNVAIIPISAKTGEGIKEILTTLVGLTQKYMENKLEIKKDTRGFATILEVKNTVGFGTTYDVILYDGKIKKGDIVLAINKELELEKSFVKAILKPNEMNELRDKSTKFDNVSEIYCAKGIKLSIPNLENIEPGSPIITLREKENNEELIAKYSKKLIEENTKIDLKLKEKGVLIKSDTIGGLEALSFILEEHNIPIRRAEVGKITKKDILDVNVDKVNGNENAIILNFSQQIDSEILSLISEKEIKLFSNDVIYKLVEDTQFYLEAKKKENSENSKKELTFPGKCIILENCIFKNSKPAVVGVEVLNGDLTVLSKLIDENNAKIGEIKQIKDKTENLKTVKKGQQIAISIDKLVVGKNGDVNSKFYVDMTPNNFKSLIEIKDELSEDQKSLLKEFSQIKRKKDPFWGK